MLTLLSVFGPIPKKVIFKTPTIDSNRYFNYKEYVSISKICENLLKEGHDVLFDSLSIFSKNHYRYRDIFYYNLQSVDVKKVTNSNKIDASYELYDDVNLLKYVEKDSIYHEIIHIASSFYDKYNNILYTGFNYCDLNNKINIGEGLTEGYVQLITDRDTNNGNILYEYCIDDENINIRVPIYCYANVLAEQLEVLLGKEQTEEIFFNADFKKFMEILLQYSDLKTILKFLKNCDIAAIAGEHESKLLDNKVLEAQSFLFDICEKNMPEKYAEMQKRRIIFGKELGYGHIVPKKILDEIYRSNLMKN